MAPDKIYIAETQNKLIEIWSEEPIEPKPYITEHEYIRKDALLEWLKEVKADPMIPMNIDKVIEKIKSL